MKDKKNRIDAHLAAFDSYIETLKLHAINTDKSEDIRIKVVAGDMELWMQYYFPDYMIINQKDCVWLKSFEAEKRMRSPEAWKREYFHEPFSEHGADFTNQINKADRDISSFIVEDLDLKD